MRTLAGILFSIWGALWGAFWTFGMAAAYLLVAIPVRTVRWMDFCQSTFAHGLLFFIGMRLTVVGKENLLTDRNAIVMANHRSWLDIPTVVKSLPHLRFVAKEELGRIPIFGWALMRSEHVLINRRDNATAVAKLREMATVFGKGRNLMVFAEGTRSPSEKLLPFKKGGFHLAIDTGLPILPVSIEGHQHTLPKGRFLLRPGRVVVTIHPVVEVDGLTRKDIPELRKRIRETVLSGLPGAAALEAGSSAVEDAPGGSSGKEPAR